MTSPIPPQGDILEDIELIENLEETKRTAMDIEDKVRQARSTEASISKAREVYRPVAARGSLVYFLIDGLNALDRCGVLRRQLGMPTEVCTRTGPMYLHATREDAAADKGSGFRAKAAPTSPSSLLPGFTTTPWPTLCTCWSRAWT